MINTSSETFSMAKRLDEQAASFYAGLSSRFGPPCAILAAFAAESKKFVDQISRAYYGVITDAIEGCFSFEIDPDEYIVNADISQIRSAGEALAAALQCEETLARFYKEAGRQGSLTMADFGRALVLVARKREERIARLRSTA
ncbi:MAG: hypothetical protein HYX90_08945 [Chloroflexi bacterium]|nr:hypothetical protein [Chloroflexota bacterium]